MIDKFLFIMVFINIFMGILLFFDLPLMEKFKHNHPSFLKYFDLCSNLIFILNLALMGYLVCLFLKS